jgi:cytochrome oxidase Cu insertion factor (SCO1/SenC/PrrC family)
MQRIHDRTRQAVRLAWIVGLMIAPLTLGSIGSAQAAEDPFDSMAVQRPAQPGPAPDLALPSLEGGMVDLKDFRGKVVLLGFFTTA